MNDVYLKLINKWSHTTPLFVYPVTRIEHCITSTLVDEWNVAILVARGKTKLKYGFVAKREKSYLIMNLKYQTV